MSEMWDTIGKSVFKDQRTLSFDYVPPKLVHRETQMKRLIMLFRPVVDEDGAQNAVLTGSVGTGKTATAKRFCTDLKDHAEKKQKAIDWTIVNCRQRNSESAVVLQIVNHFQPNFPDRGFSITEMKLDSMLEFNDSDDNGLLNYTRSYDGDAFLDYTYDETVYKRVDLTTAWNASEVIETDGDDNRSWEFSLTATDLPYDIVNESAEPTVGDNVLNELKLTFHLTADLVQYDNVSLPQWRITVTTGPLGKMVFMTADRLENMQVTGKILKYDVKWDQEITGWDYDPNNTNPAVLIEFHSLVGNFISPLMATWMQMNTLTYMNAVGVMNCESTEGELDVDETTGTLTQPKELIRTRLSFGSDWTSIGALTWVDNVTVDGEPELVKAQIMAGHRIVAMAKIGGEWAPFTGFVALGALVFPGGTSIVHDPVFSSEALVEISTEDTTRLPVFLLLIGAVVIVLIVVAIAAVTTTGKKAGKGDQGSYERSKSSQPGDWSKYYGKK